MSDATGRLRFGGWATAVLAFLLLQVAAKAHVYKLFLQDHEGQDQKGSPAAGVTPPKTGTTDARGNIEGQTYQNTFLDLEFTLPEDLQFQEQPQSESDPATGAQIIAIHAGSKPGNRFALKKYRVNRAMMFVADPLARYSLDQRTDAAYMRRMTQVEKAQGFKQTGDVSIDKIGDVTFSRANFVNGKRNHVLFATERKGYAFVFIFVANDLATADGLAKSTTLRLPE